MIQLLLNKTIICMSCIDMLSLLYSTVLLYYICFCFVLSCTLLIGGNKEILLLYYKMIQLLLNKTTPPFQLLPMPKVD